MSISCCRFQELAVTRLHSKGIYNCETIKFFNNRKYVGMVREYGNVHLLSASQGEASHEEVKAAYQHTNKHSKAVLQQVQLFVLHHFCTSYSMQESESDSILKRLESIHGALLRSARSCINFSPAQHSMAPDSGLSTSFHHLESIASFTPKPDPTQNRTIGMTLTTC